LSGVFLSYSRGDRALAAEVIIGLRRLGVEVWWDEDMPGVDWQLELERQINELAAVLVLWTPLSAKSMNVRDEARLGQQNNKLVNGLAGIAAPPFPFDRYNGLPLDGLTDRAPHAGWARLVQTIEEHLVRDGAARPGEITGALARHDQAVRAKQEALTEAEAAYQNAKVDEDAEATSGEAAAAALKAAEEQLGRVVAMRGTPSVLRAAHADLEAAQAAKDEADRARKAAGAALTTASRNLSAARSALERLFDRETAPIAPPASRAANPGGQLGGVSTSLAPPTSPPGRAPQPAAPTTVKRRGLPWLPIGIAGAAGVAALGWLALSHQPNASAGTGDGRALPIAAALTSASPAGSPSSAADLEALTGEWSGNGATCEDPLAIIVTGRTISAVVGGAAQKGSIKSISADGLVSIAWPDGAWTYKVAGDTLTMTPASGSAMAYQRCAG
jgi:TIR domain-containing protein